ncbi:bifunctional lysylphosphatidylglycerol flippase/synthetase MprF [Amnibacterium sp.]|uniref:bifunctional lysylphosphatidylglycerol flippase/synthetase MprF n=1 Tax=Amnibacterium sp. TaxID=1872496 RepID=UPI003F7B5D28
MSGWVRDRAVALTLAVVTLVAAVTTGSALRGPGPAVRAQLGLGVDGLVHGRVQTLVTSVLLAGSGPELLLALAAIVLVVGACERLIGHGRVLLAWIATAVLGGAAGTVLQGAGLLAHGFWTTPPATLLVLHPETPVLGVLLVTSAFMGPLWRRRIRVVGLAALLVLLLYSGQPEDLDHLAGAVVGLLLGLLLTRRRARIEFLRSSHHETRGLLAAVVAVAALGPVVAVLQPRGYGLLRPLGRLFRDTLPPQGRIRSCADVIGTAQCLRGDQLAHLNGPGALLLPVLPLLVLLVAAFAIQHGRQVGIWLAAGVNGLLALLGAVYYGLYPVLGDADQIQDLRGQVTVQSALAVLVPLSIAVAAVLLRRHCPVLPERRVLVLAATVLGAAVVAAGALFVGVGVLLRGQFSPAPTPADLLVELPQRFVPVGFLRFRRIDFVPIGPAARILDGWVGVLPWLALLLVAVALTGSVRRTTGVAAGTRLRAVLRGGAGGSLSWMTTWPGNRTWFSADGRHAIAYREGSGVALTVGEPAGPADGREEAARAFAVDCDDRGLIPAFYSVGPDFADALGGSGAAWATVEVGEDTVIDPAAFTMKGKHWQDVRSSFNRADRAGIRSVWTDWSSLPIGQRTQVEAISEEWVAEKRLPELGFTLGGIEELTDPDVHLMLAVGPGDRVEAVTSWLPTWEEGEPAGLTLDFMRRRPDSMNGVMEFVIASVVGIAQQRGLRFVSLSVAPLAGVGADQDDRLQRLLGGMANLLEPAYGFASLAAYKEKFKPEHRPQVLAYPDAVALPAIGVAVARAYLPDIGLAGFGRVLGALRPEVPDERRAARATQR